MRWEFVLALAVLELAHCIQSMFQRRERHNSSAESSLDSSESDRRRHPFRNLFSSLAHPSHRSASCSNQRGYDQRGHGQQVYEHGRNPYNMNPSRGVPPIPGQGMNATTGPPRCAWLSLIESAGRDGAEDEFRAAQQPWNPTPGVGTGDQLRDLRDGFFYVDDQNVWQWRALSRGAATGIPDRTIKDGYWYVAQDRTWMWRQYRSGQQRR